MQSMRILLPRQSYSHVTFTIRNNSYQILNNNHDYARNGLAYNYSKLINATSNMIIEKLYTHSYFGVSLYSVISSCNTECNITNFYMYPGH